MHYLLFSDVVDDFVTKRAQFRAAHLKLLRQAAEVDYSCRRRRLTAMNRPIFRRWEV